MDIGPTILVAGLAAAVVTVLVHTYVRERDGRSGRGRAACFSPGTRATKVGMKDVIVITGNYRDAERLSH